MTTTIDNIRVSTLIDLKNTTMTLFEVLARVEQYRSMPYWQGKEIYLDGATLTICAKEALA